MIYHVLLRGIKKNKMTVSILQSVFYFFIFYFFSFLFHAVPISQNAILNSFWVTFISLDCGRENWNDISGRFFFLLFMCGGLYLDIYLHRWVTPNIEWNAAVRARVQRTYVNWDLWSFAGVWTSNFTVRLVKEAMISSDWVVSF